MEKKEVALKKMLATVMKDKEKIEETIEELDRYKRDALQKTWEKVNGCVSGSISLNSVVKRPPPLSETLGASLQSCCLETLQNSSLQTDRISCKGSRLKFSSVLCGSKV